MNSEQIKLAIDEMLDDCTRTRAEKMRDLFLIADHANFLSDQLNKANNEEADKERKKWAAKRQLQERLPSLIGLCGFKRAGKDTVARELVASFGYQRFAFADAVREELQRTQGIAPPPDNQKDVAGADGKSYRDKLIELGEGRRRAAPLYWVQRVDAAVRASHAPRVVVSDCRTADEIAWVRAYGGALIWIERAGVTSNGHDTEQDHQKECDSTLHNDGRPADVLIASMAPALPALQRSPARALVAVADCIEGDNRA